VKRYKEREKEKEEGGIEVGKGVVWTEN